MSANGARASVPVPRPGDPATVTGDDLKYIDELSALLSTLNDPRAGAEALARHVEKIPVLKARIARRYLRGAGRRVLPETAQQIALLGNRELEAVLFELLEDLVAYPDRAG